MDISVVYKRVRYKNDVARDDIYKDLLVIVVIVVAVVAGEEL